MHPVGAAASCQSPLSRMAIDDIPLDQRKFICTMIDYSIHEGNGHWDMIVSELGFSETDSKNFLLAFPKGQSPTENLLRECNYRNYRVAYFLHVLKKVGMVSLTEKIGDELEEKCKHGGLRFGQSMDMIPHRSIGSDQSISDSDKIGGLDTIQYSYEEIEKGTNHFAPKMKLGAGAFGKVYKVKLKNTTFACKVLTISNTSPHFTIISKHTEQRDLRNELQYLAEYRHPNIIPLYGWSLDGEDPCLIYQYMKNGSLQDCLQRCESGPLKWVQRIRIACDAATGLQFLHTIKEKPLIHGDIKTANILLDEAFGAKLGDFGLAREGPRSHVTGSYIKLNDEHTPGTVGYLAPEYLRSKKLSVKVDTYAFGVVLHELFTGRMAFSRNNRHEPPVLLRDFMDNIATSSSNEQVSQDALYKTITQEIPSLPKDIALKFVRVALECCHEKRNKRPSMPDVLIRLEALCGVIEEVMSNSDKDGQNSGSSSGSLGVPSTLNRRSWITGSHQLSRTPVESVDDSSVPNHNDNPGIESLPEDFHHMRFPNAASIPFMPGMPQVAGHEMNGNPYQQTPNPLRNPLWLPNCMPPIGQHPNPPFGWSLQPNPYQVHPVHQNIPMHPLQMPFYQPSQYNEQNVAHFQYSRPYANVQEPGKPSNTENPSETVSNHTATTPVTPGTPGNFSTPDSFSSTEYEGMLVGPGTAAPLASANPLFPPSVAVLKPTSVHVADAALSAVENNVSEPRDILKVNSAKAKLMECLNEFKKDADVSEIFEKLESNDPYT